MDSGRFSVVTSVASAVGSGLVAVFAIIVLASLPHAGRVPWFIFAALAALAVLAVVRPAPALLTVAALTPVVGYLGRRLNWEVEWAETLVVAFAAGWWVRSVRQRPGTGPALRGIRSPATAFAIVIVASVAVALSVDHMRLGSGGLARALWQYFAREYFTNSAAFPSLHAAALLIEGVLLFVVAATLSVTDPRFTARATRTLAASAAVAAALNLLHLATSAARFDHFWSALAERVATVRINEHYGDVNAAGSQFALLFFVAAGLCFDRRRPHAGWLPVALMLALGVWMSGSRTALVAVLVAIALLTAAWAHVWSPRRGRLAVWGAAAVLALTAVAADYTPTRGNQTASSMAVRIRVELARTAGRMVADSPVFGIGPGQFYQRSGEFSSPELLAMFPAARHENAHNNFLQVLSETGVIGLSAFIWLLAAATLAVWRVVRQDPSRALAWGGLAGIVAFLLTCLGGHPLLTPEAAYSFWLFLGVAAGGGAAAASAADMQRQASARTPLLLMLTAALVISSIPFRAAAQRGRADLEHRGIGLTTWSTSEDGLRYRSAVDEATLFVPADAGFRFRVRSLAQSPVRLELRLDGRVADVVRVDPGQWADVAFVARSERGQSRFSQLHLRVLAGDGPPVTLHITKVEER